VLIEDGDGAYRVLDWGGFIKGKDYSSDVYRFDLVTSRWENLASRKPQV
jgi:hypothetical protein